MRPHIGSEVNLFSSYLPGGVKWCVLLSNCLNWKIYCDDHSSLSSTTAIQKWIISYILHIVSNFIDHAISFNLSNAGKIFWTESERTVSEFRKRKKKLFCVAFTYSVKRAREIRKFHVAVLQGWLKMCKKAWCTCKVLVFILPWWKSWSCAKEKSSGVEKLRTWRMISQGKHRGNRRFYIIIMATILKNPHILVHISTLPRNREMSQRNYT